MVFAVGVFATNKVHGLCSLVERDIFPHQLIIDGILRLQVWLKRFLGGLLCHRSQPFPDASAIRCCPVTAVLVLSKCQQP
jgi:hypothetical protein